MDPPWQLSTATPSRGVAIAYDSLSDEDILKMPIDQLSHAGLIFIWTINAKYAVAINLMCIFNYLKLFLFFASNICHIEKWGYKMIDELTWVKKTINGKIAKSHGFYLQHAKESCLIGQKVLLLLII